MLVYRISQTKYAGSLNASGVEGRWNSAGRFMFYTGASISLSCLEMLAHRTGVSLSAGDFSLATIHIPDDILGDKIGLAALVKSNPNWHHVQNYPITQKLGNEWLQTSNEVWLKVPSSIIEDEFNYLLNPAHPDFTKISLKKVAQFSFDSRLKSGV